MWLPCRACLLTLLLLSSRAWADASYELLLVTPRAVPDVVWQQAIGFVELRGLAATTLQTWVRSPSGEFTRGGTLTLGALVPISSAGYHPPESPEYVSPSRLPVLATERGHLRLVIDPLRPRSAWFLERELGERLPGTSRSMFTNSTTRRCCAQLLFLEGADRVEVFAKPGGEKAFKVLTPGEEPQWLEVVEVRAGWVKVENHFNALGGKPEGFRSEPGWIRLRDERGRLVFWFVDPDSC